MAGVKLAILAVTLLALATTSAAGYYREKYSPYSPLKLGFYVHTRSCFYAESIIKKVVIQYVSRDPSLAASLLRMHFHDCFVRGCEASVLLNSTKKNVAEKDSIPNLSLRGFEVIDAAKAAVEAACPNQVSCADILALAARDAVEYIHGPCWDVPTGRRDGIVSISNEALTNLPPFFANFTMLQGIFASKGLDIVDLVALSGGHTIGVSHCSTIDQRLHNFTGKGDTDPSLDPAYAAILKAKCKPGDLTTKIPMDATVSTFDTSYYQFVKKGKALFQSDAALLTNRRASLLVSSNAAPPMFLPQFSKSMTKMGLIGVLTGNSGQIRKTCSLVN